MRGIKIVCVGDTGVGKTSLLGSHGLGEFLESWEVHALINGAGSLGVRHMHLGIQSFAGIKKLKR